MKISRIRRPVFVASAVALVAAVNVSSLGAAYVWVPTAGGTSYDWTTDTQDNWGTGFFGPFPSAPGDIASINNNIAGNQTVRLQQPITIGTLNIGDADGTNSLTISGPTASNVLMFDSGTPGVAAAINMTAAGATTPTPANTISAPVQLLSNLVVSAGAADANNRMNFFFAGPVDMNGRTMTFTNGVGGITQFEFGTGGTVSGSGTIINNSNTSVNAQGSKAFTGTLIANKGIGATNSGSFTMTTGGWTNAAEFVINGYLSGGGIVQNGGTIHAGNNSGAANNPGQRFTTNRITLNGGTLSDGGQTAAAGASNWGMGLEAVTDNVAVLDFNSGFSHITMAKGVNTAGTNLNITTIERSPGATVYLRSQTLGAAQGSNFNAANANTFLIGGGGAEGTTTMSIIPWIAANNTNAGTSIPTGFATVTPLGIRALNTTATPTVEYATSLNTATIDDNVNTGSIAITGTNNTVAINSLRQSNAGATNLGSGNKLVLRSGGLFFGANNAGVGVAGSATAGTLQFGNGTPTEGVVWSVGTNTNFIGASITGTGGLTKAGTGTLTLTGANNYSGLTYVGGGILQVGDGTNLSTLGLTGDVKVANGATLSLMNGLAIADTATLTLESFGLFNGKLSLGASVNETVGALYLGDLLAPPGTYGSSLSTADNRIDTWFSGTGVLTVVPEPGSAALLLGGLAMVAGRRRRK